MRQIRWQGNALLGLGLTVLGLLAMIYLVPSQVANIQGFGLPSYIYPRVILGFLTASAAGISLFSIWRKNLEEVPGQPLDRETLLAVAPVLGLVVLYVAAIFAIGFMIVTPFFLTGLLLLFGERNPWRVVGTAILVPAAVYALFTGALKLMLP